MQGNREAAGILQYLTVFFMVFQYFSKSHQNRCPSYKITPNSPKIPQKCSQEPPKRLPRQPQDPPKRPQERPRGSKILSRAPKIAKISHPEPPRAPERVPRGSKRLPRSPKSLLRASQDPQKSSQKAPKMLTGDLQASILSLSNIMLVLKPLSFSKHLNFLASKPPSLQLSRGGMRGAFE